MGTKLMNYEWMAKPTPQEEWIEGGGKTIWLALFFTETGAGLFFVSIFFKNPLGMILGWVLCLILGCGFFMLHMGHPLRAYRAILRPQSSWISRGGIFLSSFGALGALYILLSYLMPARDFMVLKIIVGLLCILVAIYAGMLMSYVRAVPLWNSGLLPMSYVVAGLWSGAEILLAIHLFTGAPIEQLELWIRILLPSFALVLVLYLISITSSSAIGWASVKRIIAGDLALHFYLGAVIIGLVFPIIVVLYSLSVGIASVAPALILAAVACGLIGDLTIRYCILKGALYSPVV
ncbi:MAG: dimethyl sulfoxide reductase anchor subunit [Desulfobacteraceae bacterium]